MQNFCVGLKFSEKRNRFESQRLQFVQVCCQFSVVIPHLSNPSTSASANAKLLITRCELVVLRLGLNQGSRSYKLRHLTGVHLCHWTSDARGGYYQKEVLHTIPFLDTFTGFCIGSSVFCYWAAYFYPRVTRSYWRDVSWLKFWFYIHGWARICSIVGLLEPS